MNSQISNSLPEAKWELYETTLALKIITGLYIPTTLEFLSIQYGRISTLRDHIVKPLSGGNGPLDIKISKFPARIRLQVVEPNKAFLTDTSVEFFAEYMGDSLLIPYKAVSYGHCIINGTWYAFAQNDITSISDIVTQFPSLKSGKLSVGDYLKFIYKKHNIEVKYLECSSLTAPEHRPNSTLIGLNANLYPYQKTGISWLRDMAAESVGGILADEMGLGKTLQIIGLLLSEINSGRSPNLIICPSTLMENWRREILKFAPSVKPYIHHGNSRTGWPDLLSNSEVIITTYETAVRDEALFLMINWATVILDEAQAIKNPLAEKTKVVKRLQRRVSFAVTGTPVENTLEDLWSILDFSIPGYLGPIAEFKSRFQDDIESADTLRRITDPLILRRRVSDVATDLPQRIDIESPLLLNEQEARGYEQLRESADENQMMGARLAILMSLRQYCCHPNLANTEEDISSDSLVAFSKAERLAQIIEEISPSKEKILIFTSYTRMANSLADFVKKNFGLPVWLINGEIPPQERQVIVDKFSGIIGSAVLIINPRAGGSGLNITAANHVIIYNPEWNPALEMQCIARAHRRGQVRPVTIHYLYYANTVEEAIVETSRRKRQLADTAIVGHDGDEDNQSQVWDALRRRPIM